ncbi:MAG: response regulator [Candidatus Saccharimonas sp.]|nr:response regulator [Candidatus Saccharimonas sp.]
MTKILLVEDDKSLREIYGVRLLAEGYDIVSAGDGEEALAMAIKDRPDLIVSDVMMPKISGFDMLDILRSTTETKGIKVIMMTALSSEEQRQRGVALGADRYLVKSQVGIEDVVRTVHEVLADAPVSSPAAVPSAATVTTTPTALVAPIPVLAPASTPMSSPIVAQAPPAIPQMPSVPVTSPTVSPAPVADSATSMPTPQASQPVAPDPVQASQAPATAPLAATPASSVLPSPTPPLDQPTPKQNLASRVIEPLPSATSLGPNLGDMMNQELSQPSTDPFATNPPAAPGSIDSDIPSVAGSATPAELSFEETPQSPQPLDSSANRNSTS